MEDKKAMALYDSYVSEVVGYMEKALYKRLLHLAPYLPQLCESIETCCIDKDFFEISSEDRADKIILRPVTDIDKSLWLREDISKYYKARGFYIQDEYYHRGTSYVVLVLNGEVAIYRREEGSLTSTVQCLKLLNDECVEDTIELPEELLKTICIVTDAFLSFAPKKPK